MITEGDLQREEERGGAGLERGREGKETEIMEGGGIQVVEEEEAVAERGGGVDPHPHSRIDHLVALEDPKLRPCTSEPACNDYAL